MTYDNIGDLLKGKTIDTAVEQRLLEPYVATQHKREPIRTIYNA